MKRAAEDSGDLPHKRFRSILDDNLLKTFRETTVRAEERYIKAQDEYEFCCIKLQAMERRLRILEIITNGK